MGQTTQQGSEQHRNTRRRREYRGGQVGAALFAALLLMLASPMLWSASGHETRAALAAPLIPTGSATASATADPAASPSPTATPAPATLAIVSPSSRSGPVGAHVTVSGQNFTGSAVALYGTSDPNCGGVQTPLGSTQVTGGGTISVPFIWPLSLNANRTYYICGAGVSSPPGYQVLSASAPAVQLDPASVEVGKQETISGTNFLGLPAGSTLTIAIKDSKGKTTTLPQALVDENGSFNLPWTVGGATGAAIILAQSAPENGAAPALQATATLTILVAASPTAATSPVASPTVSGTGSNGNGGNAGVIVALIVGIVLLLLVILGIAAFLLLRKRGGPPDAGGYGDGHDPSAYPGYADRNRAPVNVPQGQTGRQPAAGRFGQSGLYDQAETFSGPPVGGVAQWDDPDATAGMNWQPRPMTGYGPYPGQPGYDEGPTNPGAMGGPADPWASQAGGYGAPPAFNPDDEWEDGVTQAADPTPPRRPPASPRQGVPPADPFAPRSSGDTNLDTRGNW